MKLMHFYLFVIILSIFACSAKQSTSLKIKKMSPGVFILGGIHQSHTKARIYTYERMGEIYKQLRPDILCIETLGKYVEDKSYKGTPYDFYKYIVPAAQKDGIPIYGIDWWNKDEGEKWRELQSKASRNSSLEKEIELFGGMFKLLSDYFEKANFYEINSELITQIWAAKSNFKYDLLKRSSQYKHIFEFEEKRNKNIVKNILNIIQKHPNKSILVGVGIDHKFYIEKELTMKGITILQARDFMR